MDIWQQYQDTGSLSFLQQYYPVMEQAATFLLAYQSVGSDGFLHAVANAHETPVGGAGPDRRHRRGPGAVPGGDQRGDAAEHRFLAGRRSCAPPRTRSSPTRG